MNHQQTETRADHRKKDDRDVKTRPDDKLARKIKDVTDEIGCKANAVMENFSKDD